jgi:hypothetical protein
MVLAVALQLKRFKEPKQKQGCTVNPAVIKVLGVTGGCLSKSTQYRNLPVLQRWHPCFNQGITVYFQGIIDFKSLLQVWYESGN